MILHPLKEFEMRRFVLRVAAVALALVALPAAADAGWMAPYTGNTQMALPVTLTNQGDRADGVVNFAVYDNTDGSFNSFFSTGFKNALGDSLTNNTTEGTFGSLSGVANSNYIYVYQVVNSNPVQLLGSDSALDSLFLRAQGSLTAGGWANGFIFNDGTADVGPTGNQRLGHEGPDFDLLVDGIPSETAADVGSTINVNTLTVVSHSSPNARNIAGLDLDTTFPGSVTPAIQFDYDAAQTGKYTYLMILASNQAPIYRRGTISDGSHTDGDVPLPSPEPGTLALIGLGLPLLGWGYVRRLRASKAVAAAVAQ